MKNLTLYFCILLFPIVTHCQINPFQTGLYNAQNTWGINPAYSSVQKYSFQILANNYKSFTNLNTFSINDFINGKNNLSDFLSFNKYTIAELQNLAIDANIMDAQITPLTGTVKIKRFGFGFASQINVNLFEAKNLNFPFLSTFAKITGVGDLVDSVVGNGSFSSFNSFKPFILKPINNYNRFSVNGSYKIIDNAKFAINGGLTLSYYNTFVASGINVKQFDANVKVTTDSVYINSTGIDASLMYALPKGAVNLSSLESNINFRQLGNSITDGAGNGFGFDLGGTIIWKGSANYKKKGRPYKYIAGLSFMDLGSLKTNSGLHGVINIKGSGTIAEAYNNLDTLESIDDIQKYFKNAGFTTTLDSISDINIALPSRVVLHGDAHLISKFYAGAYFSIPLIGDGKKFKLAEIPTRIMFTPRFETKMLSFMVPVDYESKNGKLNLGAGVGLGPFKFGINNITGLLSNFNNMQVYIAASNVAR